MQQYPYKYKDPFKNLYKEPKAPQAPHVITIKEQRLIAQLRSVIADKGMIRFWYRDTTSPFFDGWRTVEPHLIGQKRSKTENIVLSGWFIPTQEQKFKDKESGWREYILDGLDKLEMLPMQYARTRQGYNPKDSRMKTIFCATERLF